MERKYNLSFAELLDRLTIVIQKVIFAEGVEMKEAFVKERDDIIHDLDLFLKEGVEVSGKIISHIATLQLVNHAIWDNESAGRGDGGNRNYELSHSLNANRGKVTLENLINRFYKGIR